MTRLLFLHGAGGYLEDRPMADRLAELLRAEVDLPELPDDDTSVAAWSEVIVRALDRGPDHVIAHSFGASILLHVLAAHPVPAATLLAAPDWSPAGWDVPDYAWPSEPPGVALTLHHCRDDDVVPFSHLALHAARLPGARVHEHPRGGHQFEGVLEEVARVG